jgi:hypothetical protein
MFIVPTVGFLITLILGIILFFVFLGIAAAIYDDSGDYENDQEFDNLQSEDSTDKSKKINSKNSKYLRKKKRRKRYYREHVGKGFKEHNKALISKDEYYKNIENSVIKGYPYDGHGYNFDFSDGDD